AEGFCHLAVSPNTSYHFLTDVATFGVTDGALLQTGFGRKIGFVHIRPEARNASFDPRHFQRFPPTRSTTAGFRRDHKSVPSNSQTGSRHEEVKAARSAPGQVHNINLAEQVAAPFDEAHRMSRQRDPAPQPV